MRKKITSKPSVSVNIMGEGHDEWGHRYIKFGVVGSDRDIPPFSVKDIIENNTALFAELANAGADAFFDKPARNDLLRQLGEGQPEPAKFKVVTRLGWNSGAFVLPGKIVGKPSKTLELSFRHLDQPLLAKYRVKGTLEQWQKKVGNLFHQNSRLMFCASLGLTGPILPLVGGPTSGGFQLFGPAESGKTAAAMVTGSIWGCHKSPDRRKKGFAESWNTTAGKIEITALAHNETVLILDETKRAGRKDRDRAENVREISFGLAENVEKERLTNVGTVRGWRFYFLSTSNFSFDDFAQRGGIEIDDAERGRFVDIPLPDSGHGIYEDLHQFESGEKFTDALKIRCRKYCGSVGDKFLSKLVRDRANDREWLKQFLRSERTAYLQAIKTKTQAAKVQPLKRASGRFATVFAAGSLAIKYGIFRWKRAELLQAILKCQLDGLQQGAVVNQETPDNSLSGLRRRLLSYLNDHRKEFRNLNTNKPRLGKHRFGSAPGYSATFKGKKWFYLADDQLNEVIGRSANATQLMKELVDAGLMASRSDGKCLVQRPIFADATGNKGYKWVHAFRAKILQESGFD
jgi:putative DNA primase/helicase